MHPADLLPELFDTVVKRWTGYRLRPEQRAVIPSMLINCVGEAVLRRYQYELSSHERDPFLSEDVTRIVTADRFSERWMSRREIIDTITYASGLPRELAGLAVTLIEFRVDHALFAQRPIAINGLGTVSFSDESLSERPEDVRSRDSLFTLKDLEKPRGPFSRILAWYFGSQRLVEDWLAYEAERRPRSYTIELAPSLAVRKDTREPRDLDIFRSKANEFELAVRRPRPRDEEGAFA